MKQFLNDKFTFEATMILQCPYVTMQGTKLEIWTLMI